MEQKDERQGAVHHGPTIGMENSVQSNGAILYDLLLPNGVDTVVSVHWRGEPVLHRLRRPFARRISCCLTERVEHSSARQWLGIEYVVARSAQLPFAPNSIDCVILHGTLDHGPRQKGRRAGLALRLATLLAAKAALTPSGVLAVAVNNLWSLENLRLSVGGLLPGKGEKSAGQPGVSLWGCHHLLRKSGFRDAVTFAVTPDLDQPSKIISTQRSAAGAFYTRTLPMALAAGPYWARFARAAITVSHMQQYFESSYFILARA